MISPQTPEQAAAVRELQSTLLPSRRAELVLFLLETYSVTEVSALTKMGSATLRNYAAIGRLDARVREIMDSGDIKINRNVVNLLTELEDGDRQVEVAEYMAQRPDVPTAELIVVVRDAFRAYYYGNEHDAPALVLSNMKRIPIELLPAFEATCADCPFCEEFDQFVEGVCHDCPLTHFAVNLSSNSNKGSS